MKPKIINIPIDKIVLLEKNPRTIEEADFEKLKQDISNDPQFLLQRPPLVNLKDGQSLCYAGSQRVRACRELGYKTIGCFVEQNIPDKVQDKRMLQDNLHRGKWDVDKLLNFDFEIFELKEIGFEDFELNVFTDDVKLEEDDYEVKLPEVPKTKTGDIYHLGDHTLMCGDSSKADDVSVLMAGTKAQLIFTDPPYNVDYHSSNGNSYDSEKYGGTGGKIFNDNQSDSDCIKFYSSVLKNLYEHSTDDCPIYWWYASKNYPLNSTAFLNAKWHISQNLIWLKESMVFGMGQDYHRCYEPCLFGWKKGKKHFVAMGINNLKDVFALSYEDYRDAMDVWYENRDKTNTYIHPTQKPIRLAERALKKHSLRGFIVLDLFGGSGSTLMACEQSKRIARLMEMDPKFCDAIVKRYVAYCRANDKEVKVIKNGADISNDEWLATVG